MSNEEDVKQSAEQPEKQPFYKNVWIWFVVTVVGAVAITFFVMDNSDELATLEEENEALQEEVDNMAEDFSTLAEERSGFEEEKTSLEEEIVLLEEEIEYLVSDNELLYEDVTFLLMYIEELEAEMYGESGTTTGEEQSNVDETAEVNEDIVNPITELDEDEVLQAVTEDAEELWEDDYVMIEFTIEEQMKCFYELQEYVIDTEDKLRIMENALDFWEYDFMMVQFDYDEQLRAYENQN